MLTKKITALLALLAATAAAAQPAADSLLLRDYRFIQRSDPWLTHRNGAALARYTTAPIAEAELYASYGGGRLTDYYGAPKVLDAGAAIESYYRLNSRAVVFGHISYDNWTGRDMTGSAFTHLSTAPLPFDIVEDSLTNPGRKHRDTYRLAGALSYAVTDALAVGARVDYTAANYAKYKDLRHKSKFMALSATAGLYASPLPWLSAGADYTYRRQTESLQFSVNGKGEKVYKSLIDYGAAMGMVEQFGNEGYTDKSRELPLFEDGHSGSLQLELRPLPGWSLFASAALARTTGHYGVESPYTITYTTHTRHTTELYARLTYAPARAAAPFSAGSGSAAARPAPPCASVFSLDISYSRNKLQNRANTYRALLNDNGATYYDYYDPVETADKRWHNLTVGATAYLGIRGELPTWTLSAAYNWQRRSTAAYLYPYYRQQQLTVRNISAAATRHIVLRRAVLSLTASAALRTGSGAPYTDGSFLPAAPSASDASSSAAPSFSASAASGSAAAPATMPAHLLRNYDYLTARQYAIGVEARYAFRFPATRLKTYVRTAVDHRQALTATSSERQAFGDPAHPAYTTVTVALGCTF